MQNKLTEPPQFFPLKTIHTVLFLVGFVTFVLVAIYHIQWENLLIGIICAINAFMIAVILSKSVKLGRIYWPHTLITAVMSISIVLATYELGYRGLIYLFPFSIALFFHLPLRAALTVNICLFIATFIASLHTLEFKIALLTTVPMIITNTLSIMYAIAIKKHKMALVEEAAQDYLTGIANRRSFMHWLNGSIAKLNAPSNLGICYIDIDNFKRINDEYGNSIGDKILQEVAARIPIAPPPREVIYNSMQDQSARMVGDEFVFATTNLDSISNLKLIAEKLQVSLNKPIVVDDMCLNLTVSIGVTSTHSKHSEPLELMAQANQAMCEAKKSGKNKIVFYDQKLAKELDINKKILLALKKALKAQEFHLNFMPIFALDAKTIVGAEALIRTTDSTLSQFGPDKYIPIAEKMGLILDLDLMVIEMSFTYLQSLLPNISNQHFTLAVNISGLELYNQRFPEKVARLAKQYQIPPAFIEFEITETALVNHCEDCINVLKELRNQGFKLSLDDFGTGYTAFNQLQNYPVNTLKIDRTFVNAISADKNSDGLMVDTILSLAKIYKLNVIAEGVEEQHQLKYLQAYDDVQFQGYLLSKPISWQAFSTLLKASQ